MKQRILIVDGSEANREILGDLLRDEYDLDAACNGEECLEKLRDFSPDLILLGGMTSTHDGCETCRRVKASPCGAFTQVVMVGGNTTTEQRLEGYDAGADDYIVEPFDHAELVARIHVQFRLREALERLWTANATVQKFNAELEQVVEQRTEEIVATRDMAVFMLAKLADSRDPETGEHLERMRMYSQILAEHLSRAGPYADRIDQEFLDNLYRTSPLHDIGKVGIPDAILLKPGQLTRDEFAVMQRHTEIGAAALKEALSRGDCAHFLRMALDIARHHHERYNGTGYPDGLAGQAIPLAARIVALADVYDALTSERVYKAAYGPDLARTMIEEESGQHFDPVIVDAFLARYEDFRKITEDGLAEEGELVGVAMSSDMRR